MKTIQLKYILSFGIITILLACSTKKDNFVNRKWHSVNTEYNTLYNGDVALQKGIEDVKATYSDNFWEVLPLERMQITEEEQKPGDTKNPNFERAETKATKAIQKHSMNIGGFEKNNQIDESYLMLGKSRYYEHRYLPAMEAFNYILYKYPNSNNVYQAQVWREKVNLKLENEQLAIKNLNRTLNGQKKIKSQDLADINAVLAQAYITTNKLDSAIAAVKISKKETKLKEEKARYTFILAQLYEKLDYKDSAFVAYQEVIDMKRKSPRNYTIYAHLKQTTQFDFETGDTIAFHKKIDKLLENIENKKFRDAIHHQRAVFYDKKGNNKLAILNYNKSLRNMSTDRYLAASNYKNISNIYYREKNFHSSKIYLDSTLVHLTDKNSEFKPLKKKLEILADVVKYQDIISQADSVIKVSKMSPTDKIKYYQDYIDKLKISDSITAKKLAESGNALNQNPKSDMMPSGKSDENMLLPPGAGGLSPVNTGSAKNPLAEASFDKKQSTDFPINTGGLQSSFYFYNPATVAQGKLNFKKKWGDRKLGDNWKTVATSNQNQIDTTNPDEVIEEITPDEKTKSSVVPKYTTAFYIDKLPKEEKVLDSLNTEANHARFQLGSIFKEKLKENKLAITSFEDILVNKPESKLILPTYYNLYQLYDSENPEKAMAYKQKILSEYPDSRYASAFNNTAINADITADSEFNNLYAKVEKGLYREANAEIDALLKKYDGDELNAKFDVLKAKISARLFGLSAYKTALQKIVKNYPKGVETKKIESILATDIPVLEKLDFGATPRTFNLVFVSNYPNETSHKNLIERLNKYAKESGDTKIKVSNDIYNVDKNMIVLHGILNKITAESVYNYLKEHKDYRLKDTPIIISNEDYKVVQVKKNLEEYLAKIK
ncbi:type IX secretion system periplasmic lipoprotein PorW/SprE [Flavobacterium terrigena]|uniref:type IX secretion system periplasmic lipoprotein PorW/SprE n=1 Tax=Flavobacterium terrigena TaxID=402734 RepID=UPI001C43008D|nr:gliding motility protein [Flavobacterium terrigena]